MYGASMSDGASGAVGEVKSTTTGKFAVGDPKPSNAAKFVVPAGIPVLGKVQFPLPFASVLPTTNPFCVNVTVEFAAAVPTSEKSWTFTISSVLLNPVSTVTP